MVGSPVLPCTLFADTGACSQNCQRRKIKVRVFAIAPTCLRNIVGPYSATVGDHVARARIAELNATATKKEPPSQGNTLLPQVLPFSPVIAIGWSWTWEIGLTMRMCSNQPRALTNCFCGMELREFGFTNF